MTCKTAMILAAGRGQRMRPLTDSLPKPLLPLAGKPLIQYHLEALKQAGYLRVVINHAWLGEKLEQALGDGSRFGLNIRYSPEQEALETAGGIVNALPLLTAAGETSFTVVNGDVFSDFDFNLLNHGFGTDLVNLVMVDNPTHNPTGDFCFQSNRLVSDIGDNNVKKLTFAGIAHYHKDFFSGLSSDKRPLAPLLRDKIASGQASALYHKGIWHDIGTPQRLAEVEQTLLAGRGH